MEKKEEEYEGSLDWAIKETLSNYKGSEKNADRLRWFMIWMKLRGFGGMKVGSSDEDDDSIDTTGIQRHIRTVVLGGEVLNDAQKEVLKKLPKEAIGE